MKFNPQLHAKREARKEKRRLEEEARLKEEERIKEEKEKEEEKKGKNSNRFFSRLAKRHFCNAIRPS